MSGNKLETLRFAQGCKKLETLDCRSNRLYSVSSLPTLPALKQLHVALNELESVHTLSPLASTAPQLETLDVSYNPFCELLFGHAVFDTEVRTCFRRPLTVTADGLDGRHVVQCSEALGPSSSWAGLTYPPAPQPPYTRPWWCAAHVQRTPLPAEELCAALADGHLPQPGGLFLSGSGAFSALASSCSSGVEPALRLEPAAVNWLWLARAHVPPTLAETWAKFSSLRELTIAGCLLASLEPLAGLTYLERLDVSRNHLESLHGIAALQSLCDLCASSNFIRQLQPLADLPKLEHLYLAQNLVARPRAIFALRDLTTLRVLDLSNNPMCSRPHVRPFVLYHLSQQLAIFNREPITQYELDRAQRRFANVMTEDVLADMVGEEHYRDAKALDLPNLDFRDVRLQERTSFRYLYSLNLENNSLSALEPLAQLPALRVLCLTGNRIRRYASNKPASSRTMSRQTSVRLGVKGQSRVDSASPRAASPRPGASSARASPRPGGGRPESSSPMPLRAMSPLPHRGLAGGGGPIQARMVVGSGQDGSKSAVSQRAERQAQVLASLASTPRDEHAPAGETGDGRFPSLEVLMLSENFLTNLTPLELDRIPRLRALFLDDNDIGTTAGLANLIALEVLVLDRNRVKVIEPGSLASCPRLTEVHLAANRLSDTAMLKSCRRLRRLVLESNRMGEFDAVLPLAELPKLQELVLTNNAFMRRPDSRLRVIYSLPRVISLNLITVTEEERQHAALYFGPSPEEEAARMANAMAQAPGVSFVQGELAGALWSRNGANPEPVGAYGADHVGSPGCRSGVVLTSGARAGGGRGADPRPPQVERQVCAGVAPTVSLMSQFTSPADAGTAHGSPTLPHKLMVRVDKRGKEGKITIGGRYTSD